MKRPFSLSITWPRNFFQESPINDLISKVFESGMHRPMAFLIAGSLIGIAVVGPEAVIGLVIVFFGCYFVARLI